MQGNTNPHGYTDEQMLNFIIRDFKRLGYIPPTTNAEGKIRLNRDEIKRIATETGFKETDIWIKLG